MVSPETATASPNQSGPTVSGAFSAALWRHPVAVSVKTYARPTPEERRGAAGAPATMVRPETATEAPNQSQAVLPEAASSTSCLPFADAQAGLTFVEAAIAIVAPAATSSAVARTLPIIVYLVPAAQKAQWPSRLSRPCQCARPEVTGFRLRA